MIINMVIKVSVIVPIYNTGKYLDRSVKSLINQTLKEIEIILINDGSTDNSLDICRKYEKEDSRIRVIDGVNEGVSSARNKGLDIANGEYIGFIDPDDWIEKNMYEKMYQTLRKTDSEICMCNYVIEKSGKLNYIRLPFDKSELKKRDILDELVSGMISLKNGNAIMGSACRLLINRHLLSENKVEFPRGIQLMEDLIFCIELFLKANNISIDEGIYYHYMTTENSAVTRYRENLSECNKKVFNRIKKILERESIYHKFEDLMDYRYLDLYFFNIKNETNKYSNKRLKERINRMNTYCKDEKLKNIIKNKDMSMYPLRQKIVCLAIKHGITIYPLLYYSIVTRLGK